MTLDGLLTFLTLAAAIYALMSPVSKLRAKLGMALQLPAAMAALSLVLYFEFFDVLKLPCPANFGRACKWLVLPTDKSFTAAQAAFLVVLVWMLLAWCIHILSRPVSWTLPGMLRIIEELNSEQRFAEIIKFSEPHLSLIGRAARRMLRSQQFHDRIARLRRGAFFILFTR